MRTVNRIVVTGDLLRQRFTGGSSQTENIQWLHHLVKPAIGLLCDLPVQVLTFTGDTNCLGNRMFRSNGEAPSIAAWARLLYEAPTVRDQALVWDELEGALVVAFELNERMRACLDLLQVPYLDFTIHPLRYLDDLLMGVRSNIPDLPRLLHQHAVSEADIAVGTGLARAAAVKMGTLREFRDLPRQNIALFAGQTTDDKVLIRDGGFPTPEDFLDRFEAMCAAHETVLVKPHPYARDNPMVTALTRLFSNTRLVDGNFYHLLAQPAVSHCYSLTSSTSVEAGHFGKTGVHLADYPYVFSHDSASGGDYFTHHGDFFLPSFWAALLPEVGIDVRPTPTLRYTPQRSRLRHTLRNFWGADIFEEVT